MPLFEVPNRAGKTVDSNIAKKSRNTKKVSSTVRSGNSLFGKINEIKATVEKNLGEFQDEYLIINQEDVLVNYIDTALQNKYISIDTETTGLDPLLDTLVGICVYTRNMKAAYIPLNHTSYVTGIKAEGQLPSQFVIEQFCKLTNIDIDMFNAKFDIRFLRAAGWKDAYCTWDGYLASQILNENEPTHGLKALHKKYVLKNEKDAFSFDSLFRGVTFDKIPIKVGYLYAAHDAIITTELCDYQRKYLRLDTTREDLRNMTWVFKNIEMPCISVVADMEDNGIKFDIQYQQKLSKKYNSLLKEKEEKFYHICDDFGSQLDAYREKMGVNNKLEYPINISSSSQIAIMLYDVLKIEPIDKNSPRATGEEVLSKIDHPVAKAVLEYREVKKLLSTYVDKLPECVNPNDGRIHCSFNQYGARTGRFSSSDPNLQNIPSRNHDVRKMFIATQEEKEVIFDTDDFLEVDKFTEIFTADEWILISKFSVGDAINIDGEQFTVSKIEEVNEKIRIYL